MFLTHEGGWFLVSKNEDGYFIVQTRFPKGNWLINYVLSFGSVAEVLELVRI
ncbi:hypothetical protein [Bacillus sp. 1NLA3E]|uniref:hypothetical protein n=1 Tax=Bacillus sp. 1NLA3E TaxID=666686 RepID=UPI003FA40906